jgi:hypothetical protein
LAGILTGIFLAFAYYLADPLDVPDPPLDIIISLFLIAGLIGLRVVQGGRDGIPGLIGLAITFTCLGIQTTAGAVKVFGSVVSGVESGFLPKWLVVLVGTAFYITVLGFLIFGIAMIRARVLPRPAAILFTFPLPLGGFFAMATGQDTLAHYLSTPFFVIAWLWLGYVVWSGKVTKPHIKDGEFQGDLSP